MDAGEVTFPLFWRHFSGIGDCPAPGFMHDPNIAGIHDTRPANLDHSLIATWFLVALDDATRLRITQCWIRQQRAESKRGSRMGDQGPPPPAITVSFLTHPDSSEYACESQLAVPFALPTTFCCLFVAFWFFPPELLYLLRINDRQSLEILRIYNWGCKLGCKALQQTLECAHYHWQSNHSLAYR